MNNIKEFLARFWQHVIAHDASTLDAANAYTDEKVSNSGSGPAGTNLGLVKTGGDVSIIDGVITINDDSHNHTIANIDDLQTTLNGKQATITGAATTVTGSNLATSRALISNSSGKIAVSAVTSTELGYLDGVTSAIQTQLDNKVATSTTVNGKALTGNITLSASDVGAAAAGTYAGSATAGGAANSANKLNTDAGSATQPVYFANGIPVETTYTIGKSVPSDAVFTDTTYSAAGTALGLVKSGGDVTISNGVITVSDDSHNHTIANVDNLQTTLDGKQATVTGAATTITGSNLTASRALISNANGKVAVSDVTSTELGYLDGVTSAIQTQLNGKVPTTRTINSKALSSNITLKASDVGADASGTASTAVSTHNTATDTHNDIRTSINTLTTRLNTIADSDDTTLDQMSEVVAYIKSNKSLIDGITTSKVNTSDIVNNLTTNIATKVLSAAQGVTLKGLVDAKAAASDLTSHTGNTSNPHGVTKAQVGLGNVENKSSATIRSELTKSNVTTALGYTPPEQDTTYSAATSSALGLVKSGGDVSISTAGIITVNDDSHNHIISNIDNLQTTLDGKVPTSRTINNKALSSNITLSASDVGAAPASAGLPTVSSSNNGKILQVNNGSWAIADAPQGFSGSWDDLTDRPFYIDKTVIYSGSVSADDYWVPASQSFVPDFPHKIIFDNVEYICVPQLVKGEGEALYFGNGYLEFPEQFEDSGEDFCLRVTLDYPSEFHLTTRDGSNSANLTIFGANENNKLLLSRVYLNGSLPINGVGYNSEVFNNGAPTQATGDYSHAEGNYTYATNFASHAEGYYSFANGRSSHAEGENNYANGDYSHVEGENNYANSYWSHVEGYNTIASSQKQHVQGQYNIEDTENKYAHIVGNGDYRNRSNAHTLDWDGNAWFQGNVYVGGTSQDDATAVLTTNDITSIVEAVKAQIGYPVVSATAPTLTNSNILWIDTSNGGIAKYHNGSAWVAITSVWK